MRMAKIRQDVLRHKLKESRSRLMETAPFFGILSMYLKFVVVENIRNMSTNGKCIFFNADFVSKLYPNELDFILCHQIMHIISGDIWRGRAMAGDDFHRACDIRNNAQLKDIGWNMNAFSHLGKVQYEIPLYDLNVEEMSSLEIYGILPYRLSVLDERTRKRYMMDSDFYWDYKNSENIDGIIILDIPQMTKYVDEMKGGSNGEGGFSTEKDDKKELSNLETKKSGKTDTMVKREKQREKNGKNNGDILGEIKKGKNKEGTVDQKENLKGFLVDKIGEELSDFWTKKSEKAAAMVKDMEKSEGNDKGSGSVPGGIKRKIEKDKNATIDWRKELNEFLQEEVTDYSFSPPDRRYTEDEFFLPEFNEKDYAPRDILFMVDTSGSVSRKELSKVYAEICGAVEQFRGKLNGQLGFFDEEVTPPTPFEKIQDVLSIAPFGGGGTSFHVIFEYIREHLKEFSPAMIVIFTDGCASFPAEESAMNIPVLWLISNDDITPPWGKVGRIISQKEMRKKHETIKF